MSMLSPQDRAPDGRGAELQARSQGESSDPATAERLEVLRLDPFELDPPARKEREGSSLRQPPF